MSFAHRYVVRIAAASRACRPRRCFCAVRNGPELPPGGEPMVKLRVNGQEQSFADDPSMPLLWYLRDELGPHRHQVRLRHRRYAAPAPSTSTASAVRSCITAMGDAEGAGGHDHRRPRPARQPSGPARLARANVPQCGYCQAGQIMQAAAFLEGDAKPTRRRHRFRDGRQHLSLRHLPTHPRRHQGGGEGGVT